ncbi:type II secretion system protein GspL [Sphingorhabdus sp. Alg239-R122]|uniref:type II secretion system protein GspL n=1 Tax=Sphingorhabdus sp. Alg239-R122 TaxID=2305989 RepID=UPI0023DD8ABC|nr:type II secretion system protein GspL [Sphingorhabdus sp. Alg239-R122]
MSEGHGLVLALPMSPAQPVNWWQLGNGTIISSGQSDLLESDAELTDILSSDDDARIMALLPASETTVHFAEWSELAPAQASAAASLQTMDKLMGQTEEMHCASAALPNTQPIRTVSAAVSGQYLVSWLETLALVGIDPDIVMPVGLLLPEPEEGAVAGDTGNGPVIRTAGAVFSDEPALRDALLGDIAVTQFSTDKMQAQIASGFTDPPLNMRQGVYAKKRTFKWLTRQQIQTLAIMVVVLILLSLAIFLVQIGKYAIATETVKSRTLTEAQQIFPNAADIAGAEQMVDEELRRRGAGTRMFTVPTAALFSAIEPLGTISVRQMSYQADGTVSVTLAAVRKEDIDSALILLQQRGYAVTVPPALTQDATGSVVANITVRAL